MFCQILPLTLMDFSQVITRKSESIVDQWVKAVYEDQQIEATQELTYKAVRNSLPRVMGALATVLSESEVSDLQTLVDASLEHGTIRAEQGFEPAEIAREYRLLRFIVFSQLEEDLLKASPAEMLRAVRLIDMVIDEAIARCFNSYTQGRLQELEQLQNQLKMTNQELTRLVRANQDNFSHLTHELKTPLTSIIGYADLFLRQQRQHQPDLKDSAPNLESIERVLRSGRLLLRLINDSLEISRYDAGKLPLQPVEVNVAGLIQSTVEIIEPLARSKDLALLLDCDRAPERVITDPLRLQQILTNLLSNAVRYTKSGFVKLTCWVVSDKKWAISVSDSGSGISFDSQAHIFEAYFRAENASESSDGTGLGLAIVLRLVKVIQGEIQVASDLGQGSNFTVTLPLKVDVQNQKQDAS